MGVTVERKKIPQLIDFMTPSEEAISLHEAGHACAALVLGLIPEFIEFVDDPAAPGQARNRIPVDNVEQQQLVACGAYAVEYNLFRAGRLTDTSGAAVDEKTFIQLAVGNNASGDKVRFYGESREQSNGRWPKADDERFMLVGQQIAATMPMACVAALAEALLNERRLERCRILEIVTNLPKAENYGDSALID
jgi:hypothetical protein